MLYQHDAACRVIARITRENNELRETLASIKPVSVGPQQGLGGTAYEGAAPIGASGTPMETGEHPADSVTALAPLVSSCVTGCILWSVTNWFLEEIVYSRIVCLCLHCLGD